MHVDVTSIISVDAETEEDAKQAARDIFSLHTADHIDIDIWGVHPVED